jgi:hypothetical protein
MVNAFSFPNGGEVSTVCRTFHCGPRSSVMNENCKCLPRAIETEMRQNVPSIKCTNLNCKTNCHYTFLHRCYIISINLKQNAFSFHNFRPHRLFLQFELK